jgi:RNA polymerase sigma-70 factor (TIGR02960 family)
MCRQTPALPETRRRVLRLPGVEANVTEHHLEAARMGDERAFRALVDPYRRELQVHCYRILGSVQDAEDVLQETMMAAWRGLQDFGERSSLRTWLYRIATNRCLNALRDSSRRPRAEPIRTIEPMWLEPYPDDLLDDLPDTAPGPDARYETKEAVTLAFVAALQHLPPNQRAVLVLRDVLGYRAAEVAEMLSSTETSVNSALRRARATVDARLTNRGRAPLPRSARENELVERYAQALEQGDIDRLVALLTDDALMTMPPQPIEVHGAHAIAQFSLEREWWGDGRVRLIPTRANGQPAFAMYLQDPEAPIARAHGLVVLTLDGDRISHVTRFADTRLFARFGMPATLDT